MPQTVSPQPPPENSPEPPAEEPQRLPLGTRISLYYILVFLVLFVVGPLVAFLYPEPGQLEALRKGEAKMDIAFQLWIQAMLAPAVILMTAGFVHFVDKNPLHAIGVLWPPQRRHLALRDLSAALFAATALLGLWYVVADFAVSFDVGVGIETVGASPVADGTGHLLLLALGFLAASCLEEWILRGYIYSTLREQLSWVHSAGIAALIFVLPSLASPDIVAPGLISAFLLGLILAAIRELTGSLWPCVAFHGAWNFVMGCVLSLPVSGTAVPGLRPVTVSGSELWSGGDFGPEGSWLMVFLLLLAVVALAAVLGREEEAGSEDDEAGSEGDEDSA